MTDRVTAPSAPTPPPAFGPEFGPTSRPSPAPPPISGGTLLISRDGRSAFASDPDRDTVYGVDIQARTLRFVAPMNPGDEPGRLVEDAAGRVHVALRSGGALLTLEPTAGNMIARRSICAAPRGLAYLEPADELWVACDDGQLWRLPAAGGAGTMIPIAPIAGIPVDDLRDVVVRGSTVWVSTFRSMRVLRFALGGKLLSFRDIPDSFAGGAFEPSVAWRMREAGTHRFALVHQQARSLLPNPTPSWGAPAPGISNPGSLIRTSVTVYEATGELAARVTIPGAVVPVDLAATPDGMTLAIVSAGSASMPGFAQVVVGSPILGLPWTDQSLPLSEGISLRAPGFQATSVAFAGPDLLLVQSREPALLALVQPSTDRVLDMITLSSVSREHTGHRIFHGDSGNGVACASCHPEGDDDGRTWTLDGAARRTLSLRGTLLGTAPYHWRGELADLAALAADTYQRRMGGPELSGEQVDALAEWLFALPPPKSPVPEDADAVIRGYAVFDGAGCGGCHSGPRWTNNQTVDVGTGGSFQVPSLVGLRRRAPYLHDGCAQTLEDRFRGDCGGINHGPNDLTDAQVSDLIAYLKTL
jgi:hypothetical protein